jgi:hypothetical protein
MQSCLGGTDASTLQVALEVLGHIEGPDRHQHCWRCRNRRQSSHNVSSQYPCTASYRLNLTPCGLPQKEEISWRSMPYIHERLGRRINHIRFTQ